MSMSVFLGLGFLFVLTCDAVDETVDACRWMVWRRRRMRTRRVKTYQAPAVDSSGWVRGRPRDVSIGGAAGPVETPAAVSPSSPPPDRGRVTPPARPHTDRRSQ